MEDEAQEQKSSMSFFDHLEDFRWHLIRSVIAVAVGAALAFFGKNIIFDYILFAPKTSDFITNRLLCELGQYLHTSNRRRYGVHIPAHEADNLPAPEFHVREHRA